MCYVYHYTTAGGFKSIVESRELWATSIYHLNDWTEFEHGRDAFVESAKALLKSKEAADAAAQLLSYLYDVHPPQAERNRAYRTRCGDVREGQQLSWEDHYRLSEHGVDNVLLTDVEGHEDAWDKVVDACAD